MTDTKTAEEQQLEELAARKAELAARTAGRLEYTAGELLAIEQRQIAELEALDAAQTQYGPRAVRLVETDEGGVILRRPHHAAFRKFMDKGEITSQAQEELVLSCLVYPSKPEFDKLVKLQTGALLRFANAAVELAGFRASELKSK